MFQNTQNKQKVDIIMIKFLILMLLDNGHINPLSKLRVSSVKRLSFSPKEEGYDVPSTFKF